MGHDIFISYSSKDKTIADAVCAKLEEQKIRCWIAPRDIAAGENFARAIINAINSCKVFVLLWSVNANTSEHILNEINQAFDQGITIIPFRIQEVEPTPEMRYYFGRTHWLDALTPPLEKHIDRLAETIFPLIGRTRSSTMDQTSDQDSNSAADGRSGAIDKSDQEKQKRIESKKMKFFWILFPILLIVIALFLAMIFNGFDRLFELFAPTATLRPTATQTATRPSPTATSTPTPTPTPPAWVNEYTAQILAAIADRAPDFQDDFAQTRENWEFGTVGENCFVPSSTISDGTLKVIADPVCDALAGVKDSIDYVNFVFTIEMNRMQINANNVVGFRTGDYYWSLQENGDWEVIHYLTPNAGYYSLSTGDLDLDPDQTHTITIIGYHDRKIILLDDNLVVYYVQESPSVQNFFQISTFGREEGQQVIEFDNARIWNLDLLPNLSNLLP